MKINRLSILAVAVFMGLASSAGVVVYPDYPDAIERDDAYRVRVAQGGESRDLVVWNHCEKSILANRTHGGDVNRRFCEFAFDGGPVRVDIAVTEDVRCYKVFPARLGLRHSFADGVISVWLERPLCFGIQLNDYDKSILTVIADPPEDAALIPKKGTPGVLYVDRWLDAPGRDGVLAISNDVREVYVAPGAVLNARPYVRSAGCRVHGRGIILDPMSNIFRCDQTKNRAHGTFSIEADDVTVEDVKLVDARSFNWIFRANRTRMRNTKTFSSMMCSDGMSFFSGEDVTVDRCWLYVGDNALVLSSTRKLTVRDTALGTSCAAIYPQSSFRDTPVLENVSVFRSDEGVINNYYNGQGEPQKRRHQTQSVLFRNFSAVDVTQCAWIFLGRNMGRKPKNFTFVNASFPELSGHTEYKWIGGKGVAIKLTNGREWLDTDNYHLVFTNLFIAGKAVSELPPERVVNARTNEIVFAAAPFSGEVPLAADRRVVDWTCPAGRRRKLPAVAPGANLVAETKKAHSVWQRCPSYRAKLEAELQSDGSPVYHVMFAQPGAGMQSMVTESVLAAGNGEYVLALEVRAEPAEGESSPVPLRAQLLSNETCNSATAKVGREWQRLELKLKAEFKKPETGLVSIFLNFPKGAARADFRNISLRKGIR